MNLVRRIIRAALWGIVIGGLLWILRRLLSSAARGEKSVPRPQQEPEPVLLRRDPCCGIYVAPERSLTLEQSGHLEYFCSAECRDRYVRSHRLAANA